MKILISITKGKNIDLKAKWTHEFGIFYFNFKMRVADKGMIGMYQILI